MGFLGGQRGKCPPCSEGRHVPNWIFMAEIYLSEPRNVLGGVDVPRSWSRIFECRKRVEALTQQLGHSFDDRLRSVEQDKLTGTFYAPDLQGLEAICEPDHVL